MSKYYITNLYCIVYGQSLIESNIFIVRMIFPYFFSFSFCEFFPLPSWSVGCRNALTFPQSRHPLKVLDIAEKSKPKLIAMTRLTIWTITNYGLSKFGNVENNKFISTLIFHETFDDKFGQLSVWLVSVTISGVCFRLLSKKLGISPRQLTSKDQPPIFFIFDYVLLYLIFYTWLCLFL